MATTTNYSWTTPDDTALVKDGAAAIRSLGTAIDSTVFTNAGAAVAKATVDAKGDLIAGTADNTIARLAVGANDTVLTADSSTATGLKWAAPAAGGMTLLSTTSLTSNTTTISSIPTTYYNLQLVIRDFVPNAAETLLMRFNGETGTSYWFNSGTNVNSIAFSETSVRANNQSPTTATKNIVVVNFYDYTNTDTYKFIEALSYTQNASDNTTTDLRIFNLGFNSTSAITSITLFTSGGATMTGSALLYGVK
jgi:hypothetical protein